MSASPAQPQNPPPPRPKKRHWVLRILVGIVVLLALIALVVQIVFWTDIPRNLVLSQLERNLDLKVEAKSLHTGWLGHTVLQDVNLGLPLAKHSFLKVPTMKVHTSSLFGLLLGNGISVEGIELYDPTIYVWQDDTGRWNLQEVAGLLGGVLGKKPAEAKSQSSAPGVPDVRVVNGTIEVQDNKERKTTVRPLELVGKADSAVSWTYDLHIQPDASQPPRVSLKGRLVPGGLWQHQVELGIQNISEWVRPWNANPPTVDVSVSWRGQLVSGGVSGRLDIHKAQVAGNEAYGVVNAMAGAGGMVRVTPDNLLLKSDKHIIPEVKLASGTIIYNGGDAQLQQLLVDVYGGPVRVDGAYNIHARSGQVAAQWRQLVLGKGVTNSGEFHASLDWPLPNLMEFHGDLQSHGKAISGPLEMRMAFNARGGGWTDFDWDINAPVFEWRRPIPIVLNSLKFTGGFHPKQVNGHTTPVLTLDSASLQRPDLLSGSGSYTFDKEEKWNLHIQGQNWKFRPVKDTPISFVVDGNGDHTVAKLNNLRIDGADTTLSLNGKYTYGLPKPVDANLTLNNAPPKGEAPIAEVQQQQAADFLRGTIQGNASLTGTLAPLAIDVKGTLKGREVDVFQHHVGQLSMAISGDVNADRADVRTDHLSLFGGQWDFESIYSLDNDALNITAAVSNLSLAQAALVANRQDVDGTMSGQWNIYVPGLRFDPSSIRVSGGATIKDARGPDFAADQITVRTALDRGELTVGPIDLRRGPGHGTLHVQVNVTDPHTINAGAVIDNWPLDIAAIKFHSDFSVNAPDVRIELPNPKAARRDRDYRELSLRAFANTIDVHANSTLGGHPLGDLEMYAGVWERVVDVRGIHLKLLNGRADGQARLDLENFTRSTGELTWVNLDAKVLSAFYPQLKDFSGTMTGNARLAPAQVYRPLEPLALVVKNNFINSYWRDVPFYDATLIAFIGKDEDDPAGGYRMVLGSGEHQTSTIRFDEGTMRIWGRVGRHANSTLAVQANIGFDAMSLDRFVHSYDKDAHPMPGRLAGTLTLLDATPSTEKRIEHVAFPAQGPLIAATKHPTTNPASEPTTVPIDRGPAFAAAVAPAGPTTQESSLEKLLEPLYMDGEVKLTETSLAGYTPIAGLYNLMHLGPGLDQPNGTGDVALHLERGTLQIQHLRFFNRGVEVTAAATTSNIWNLPDNPISGTAIGTAQPLKSRKFPLLADVNAIMKVIQANLTTIEFHGTVRKPQYSLILFGGIGDELKRFIVGDVSSELGTQNTSSGH